MNRQLPERPNLEHLRDEAKSLLLSLRQGDPAASDLSLQPPYKLAHAQLALARQYGFDSWVKLKKHVEGASTRVASFFAAVKVGDRDQAQRLLRQDPSLVSAMDPQSFDSPALNLAATRNDQPMIDLLLDSGANVDARSTWWAGGFGALDFANAVVSRHLLTRGATLTAHAAARLGMADELREILLKNPEAVHERGGDGQMPLHFASTPEIVDLLLDAGADLETRDIDHEGTPAQHAILNEPVLQRLLERGAAQDVFMAARRGDVELLSSMLDEDPDAVRRSTADPGNAQVPVAPGSHIYTYSLGFVTLAQVADRFGHEQVYQLLYSRATPRVRLLFSCWRGDREIVIGLLRENSDLRRELTPDDQKLLPLAAWQRNTAAVKLMLDIGFDPNVRGAEESTAVDRAAFHGFDDVIEAILPFRPDLTVVNVHGGTPLSCCVYGSIHSWRKDGDFLRSLKLLIDAGAALPDQLGGSSDVCELLRTYGLN